MFGDGIFTQEGDAVSFIPVVATSERHRKFRRDNADYDASVETFA